MLKKSILAAVAASTVLGMSAHADPLMRDVPNNHWATEAVRRLAQKNLIKGYPDGTFKGARAATRYEVAMMLSRVLADIERNGGSSADADELEALIDNFRPELDALGVRVDDLENTVGGFDARIEELERVSFYGEFAAHATFQSFSNDGDVLNDPAIPMDLVSGRPLVSGTGFTMAGLLGVNFKLSDDWDAGAEFSAFSSQGNGGVDPYWGLGAAYLNSPWTVGGMSNGDAQSHAPFTRVNLDNVWLSNDSFKLVLGSFADTNFSGIVYNGGQPNPSVYGSATNGSYGVDVSGDLELFGTTMDWEAMLTRVPNSLIIDESVMGGTALNYSPDSALDVIAYGANLGWNFDGGFVRLNFLRSQTEGAESIYDGNVTFADGTVYSYSGLGEDNSALVLGGYYGLNPNATTIYGIEAGYDWQLFNDFVLSLDGSYAHSDTKLTVWDNTTATRTGIQWDNDGDAFHIGLGFSLFDEKLDIGAKYLSVDGSFDPVANHYTNVAGYPGMYQPFPLVTRGANTWFLHDTEKYPHNREGFIVNANYSFNEDKGNIWGLYASLDQKDQYWDATLGAGSALFYDPAFNAVDPTTGSVDDGSVRGFGIGGDYDFGKLNLAAGYQNFDYERASSVAAQNIDFSSSLLNLELGYDLSDKFNLFGGVDIASSSGLYLKDPATGDNIDHTQTVPYIGFEYDLTENTAWDMDLRYFSTSGGLSGTAVSAYPTLSLGAVNNVVEFSGVQVNTTFSVKF